MLHRYPWESTALSTSLSSIITLTTPTTITTLSVNPYKHVVVPIVTTLSKYTQTTPNNLYTDRYKTKYNNNNNDIGADDSISTTTRRSVTNFFNSYYTVNSTSKVTNALKINPFKYKSVMSLSTTTKGYQNGLQNDGRGKKKSELDLYHRANFSLSVSSGSSL